MSPKDGRDMVAKLRLGNWYSAKDIAEKAGATERDVHSVLQTMCWRPQHGAKAERKKVGNEIHYRIFNQDKTVSVDELTEKLTPIIDGLIAEGKKNMAMNRAGLFSETSSVVAMTMQIDPWLITKPR